MVRIIKAGRLQDYNKIDRSNELLRSKILATTPRLENESGRNHLRRMMESYEKKKKYARG